MKINICNKCNFFNHIEVIEELKNKFDIEYIKIGCNNMCGLGRNKIVVIVNDDPIIANNMEELITKIRTL